MGNGFEVNVALLVFRVFVVVVVVVKTHVSGTQWQNNLDMMGLGTGRREKKPVVLKSPKTLFFFFFRIPIGASQHNTDTDHY